MRLNVLVSTCRSIFVVGDRTRGSRTARPVVLGRWSPAWIVSCVLLYATAGASAGQDVWLDFDATSLEGRYRKMLKLSGTADGSDIKLKFGGQTFVFATVAGESAASAGEALDYGLRNNPVVLTGKGEEHWCAVNDCSMLAIVTADQVQVLAGGGLSISVGPMYSGTPVSLAQSDPVKRLTQDANASLPPDQQVTEKEIADMLSACVLDEMRKHYARVDVNITRTRPAKGAYSTLHFIGGAQAADGPGTLGEAEHVDIARPEGPSRGAKNQFRTDKAYVYLDEFEVPICDVIAGVDTTRDLTKDEVCYALAHCGSHELGHLLGESHFRNWTLLVAFVGGQTANGSTFALAIDSTLVNVPTSNGEASSAVASQLAQNVNTNGDLTGMGYLAEVGTLKVAIRPETRGWEKANVLSHAGLSVFGPPQGHVAPTRAGNVMDSGLEPSPVELRIGRQKAIARTLGGVVAPPKSTGTGGAGDHDGHGSGVRDSKNASSPDPLELVPGDMQATSGDIASNTDVILPDGVTTAFAIDLPVLPGTLEAAALYIGTLNLSDDADTNNFRLYVAGHEIPGAFDGENGAGSDGSGPIGVAAEHEFDVPETALNDLAGGSVVVELYVPPGNSISVDYVQVYLASDAPATGACCLAQNTECKNGLSESECLNSNGVYAGEATSCGMPLVCTGPIVSFVSPDSGSSYPELSDVSVVADAYDTNPGGHVELVQFLLDDSFVDSDSNGVDGWSVLLEDLPGGDHTIQAIAIDNDGLTGQTEARLLRVECTPPLGTNAVAQVCTGTVDCPAAPLPFGPPAQTFVDPTAFDFGATGAQCYATLGRTLVATTSNLNDFTEAQFFTDAPSIEIFDSFLVAQSFPLTGCELHAAGTACIPGIAETHGVTDRVMASVSGGILSEHAFPDDSLPVSAALIAGCVDCRANSLTYAVHTSANTIETVSGGVVLSFPIGAPVRDLPISYTTGPSSGILLFTDTESHTISGGIDNVVPLGGLYLGSSIGPNGVTVATTGDGTCYATQGQIVGATAAGVGAITEAVVFTKAPSIEVISGGVLSAFSLTGNELLAGGSDCVPGIAESFGLTDRAISVVAGGALTESVLPTGATPVSAGAVGVCSVGNSLTLCVELDSGGLRCVSGNDVDNLVVTGALADRPASWTNGTISGVIAFTTTDAHVLSGGATNVTALPGDFVAYTPAANGVTVLTTGGAVNIALASGVSVVRFAEIDGDTGSQVAFNLTGCGAIGGVNAGWPPPGVRCNGGTATTVSGGAFNPIPASGPGGCGGTLRLAAAEFPFGQGIAHAVTNPNTLVVGGQLLPIGPGGSILPFADCSSPLDACDIGGQITMNIAPCEDVDAADASWPARGVECHWGSCCLPNGDCEEQITPRCCEELEGYYRGDRTKCAPVRGCCAGGACVDLVPECCAFVAGIEANQPCQGPAACCPPGGACLVVDGACCGPEFGGFATNACLDDANMDGTDDGCVPPAADGDCDGDGDVDLDDWLCMEPCVLGPLPITQWIDCLKFDFDVDLDIDAEDLQEFQSEFTGPQAPCPCNGDVNGDGFISVSDIAGVQSPLCFNMPAASCPAADVNCSGFIDQADVDVVICQLGQAAPGNPACCGP